MKALIAMSGGVDSSVAALLMQKKGFSCIGVTMKLYNNDDIGMCSDKTCCSLNDVTDAKSVCCNLGFPHYTFGFTNQFKEKVIDKFIYCYENGATPNPCIDCNRYLKFEALYRRAKELDCDKIVTGHYARIEKYKDRYLLKKAFDETKDQSYVLYSMTREQLSNTCFPCGELKKEQIRQIAYNAGFTNAKKHDSQDICFVPNGKYADFISNYTQKEYPCGDIIDKNGNVLGRHNGIIHYTIGQRKGIGLSFSEPMYVCEINSQENTITLGKNEDLYTRELNINECVWPAYDNIPDIINAKVKIRYSHKEQSAKIIPTSDTTAHIVFDEPQRAVTKGQAAVIYLDDFVVGGGIIT